MFKLLTLLILLQLFLWEVNSFSIDKIDSSKRFLRRGGGRVSSRSRSSRSRSSYYKSSKSYKKYNPTYTNYYVAPKKSVRKTYVKKAYVAPKKVYVAPKKTYKKTTIKRKTIRKTTRVYSSRVTYRSYGYRTYVPLYTYYLPPGYYNAQGYYSAIYAKTYYNGYGYNFYYGAYGYYKTSINYNPSNSNSIMLIIIVIVLCIMCPILFCRAKRYFTDHEGSEEEYDDVRIQEEVVEEVIEEQVIVEESDNANMTNVYMMGNTQPYMQQQGVGGPMQVNYVPGQPYAHQMPQHVGYQPQMIAVPNVMPPQQMYGGQQPMMNQQIQVVPQGGYPQHPNMMQGYQPQEQRNYGML